MEADCRDMLGGEDSGVEHIDLASVQETDGLSCFGSGWNDWNATNAFGL